MTLCGGPMDNHIIQVKSHPRYTSQHRHHDFLETAGGGAESKWHMRVAKSTCMGHEGCEVSAVGVRGTCR